MTMEPASTARNDYVDFWNKVLVPKFVRFKHVLVGGLTHHSDKVFPSLILKEGERAVVGAAGMTNVEFLEADVQTYPFKHDFDFCFSRFGTQFFENPVAALRNMRTSLKPGGTMTMIVWRTSADNPWLGMAKDVVLRFLPPPGEDARTCGPGPFSMANTEVVTKQLEIAGYTKVEFERIDAPVLVGNNPDDAVDFQLALGPAGEVYREAGEIASKRHAEIAAALKAALAPYQTAEGIVMDSSSWKVTARNPL